MEAVYGLYLGLARLMEGDGLGGMLLFAGEADQQARRLLRAANIADAASLVASADASALRAAMREGAIDFVVNSLDEALRILKNEIRKHQPVAVGVSVAPDLVAREMEERGVQPDLLRAECAASPEMQPFAARGALSVVPQPPQDDPGLHIIPIPEDWAQPAAAFDALLLECVPPEDTVNRRWVRLAPRYLPNACRRLRSLACNPAVLRQAVARAGEPTPLR